MILRRNKEYVEGLNSKVKLQLYGIFGKQVDFKMYLGLVMLELDSCLNLGQELVV